MKTYSEMIQANLVTFPSSVDYTLKQTIFDYFQFREVGDEDKFNVFFNRILNRDLRQYNELLRIEPGISSYDWLIGNYSEKQHKLINNETGGNNTVVESKKIGSSSNTYNETGSENGNTKTTDNNTLSYVGGQDNYHYHDADSKDTTSSAKSGREIHQHTQSARDNYDTTTGNTTSNKTENSTNTTNITGENSENKTVDNNKGYVDNNVTLAKKLPMESSYSGSGSGAGGSGSIPDTLNWSSPSEQQESYVVHTLKGDADRITSSGNQSSKNQSSSDLQSNDSIENSSKIGYNRDEINTDTYENRVDTATNIYGVKEHNKTSYLDRQDVTSANGSNIYTGNNSKNYTNNGQQKDDTNTKSDTKNNSNQTLEETEIVSGRNGFPADILKEATTFIKSSSAWSWLQSRLEPCFMGIYE